MRIVLLAAALLGVARPAAAQDPPPPVQESQSQTATPLSPANLKNAQRACEACPLRDVGMSFFQNVGINVMYGLGNLARGEHTARVTPKTWWTNMQQGMVWDLNDFAVNQIGHPYQGSNYFDAARANGLNFYESAALAAFGSATWEFFGETAHPSLNDFINTTLGGITLGEMLHRTGWLVRNTQATGKRRLWSEIGTIQAVAIDGVAQFRPWVSKGFFVKGGAGMAFVRNWVTTTGPDPDDSKALAVVFGAGWEFNPKGRLGLQVFGMQHVGALGDLQTLNGPIADVTGNFWSLGTALVIR